VFWTWVPESSTKKHASDLLKGAGLHERGFLFAGLPLNQWEVVPYDVFHLMVIGLLTLLLSIFASSLIPSALLELNWLLVHARPLHWPVVPLLVLNATSSGPFQRLKGCGESVRMQIQLLPLLLSGWLDSTKFRTTWLKDLKSLHGSPEKVVVAVRESIFAMANAYSVVFALGLPNTSTAFGELQSAVNTARRLMKSCWSGIRGISFAKTTNFHSASHLADIARRFGLTRLVSCATGECMHGILRRATAHSNHKTIEKDMLTVHNVRQSVVFLLCGGLDHLYGVSNIYSPALLQSLREDPTWRKLVKGSGSSQTYVSKDHSEQDELPPTIATASVKPLDSLGVASDTGHEHFKSVVFTTRERFASKISIGEWYIATGPDPSTPSQCYVRVESIYVHASDVYCRVQPISDTASIHSVNGLPVYESTFPPADISIHQLQRPAHVVPFCPRDSACTIAQIAPQPHAFPYSCFGLRGTHVPTPTYIVNTFFVK
jgi:hypothetical protein